jgi:Tfp pilus assembly protein PilX
MSKDRKTRRRSEKGIALLIAIFVLLLISVVAIALLVSSGTETALGANYRTSSTVYYAALAGLEEARGRLLPKNPNYFDNSDPTFIPAAPTPLLLGQTRYVINRLSSETIAPWDSSNLYYDKEYYTEFGVQASSASWQSVYSLWDYTNSPSIPGPIYKWVRITAATEQSLYLDVDSDGTIDSTPVIYYDNSAPSLIVSASPPSTAVQVLQITAFAALPNGSQKILQYLVTPVGPTTPPVGPSLGPLTFPAAVTLDGSGVQYTGPGTSQFIVDGKDESHPSPLNGPPNGCTPGSTNYPAVGYLSSSDLSNIHATPVGNYQGQGGTSTIPSVGLVTVSPNLQSVGALNNLVQTITVNADRVIAGPATAGNMPSGMTATNPMVVVVNGDLDLNSWHITGYGILLVTGELKYDPDAFWNGIVLVIGKGKVTYENNGLGTIYGALFIAQTVDSAGLPLASPGAATVAYANGNGGVGVYYSSCWIQYVQAPVSYKVLSFHEIRQ